MTTDVSEVLTPDLERTIDRAIGLHPQSAALIRQSVQLHLRTAIARRQFAAAQRQVLELKERFDLTRTTWDWDRRQRPADSR